MHCQITGIDPIRVNFFDGQTEFEQEGADGNFNKILISDNELKSFLKAVLNGRGKADEYFSTR